MSDYENYKDSVQHKEFLKKIRKNKCKECGGTTHLLKPHKETCSQFKHIIDDHYDSPCMRGTCPHCFPDYKPKRLIEITEDEYQMLLEFRKKQS